MMASLQHGVLAILEFVYPINYVLLGGRGGIRMVLGLGGTYLMIVALKSISVMDRGAWWAATYGVAQSRTRLKRLSGSSCHGYYV